MPAHTVVTAYRSTITITECRPVFLTKTEQGFHVYGTFHDGISPLPPETFSLATDDVGTPMLKRWWPSHDAKDDVAIRSDDNEPESGCHEASDQFIAQCRPVRVETRQESVVTRRIKFAENPATRA